MQGILYEEASIWQFLFVTCLLGGWAAWMTGKASAQTWRGFIQLVAYLLVLGIGVRFIHHALFGGTMFSLHYYVVDTIVLMIFGASRLPIHAHQPDGDAVSLALRKGLAAELEAERLTVHH